METQQCTPITTTSPSKTCGAAKGGGGTLLPPVHQSHIKITQVLGRARFHPKVDETAGGSRQHTHTSAAAPAWIGVDRVFACTLPAALQRSKCRWGQQRVERHQ